MRSRKTKRRKRKKEKRKYKGWDGKLIPKLLIEQKYFPLERPGLVTTQMMIDEIQGKLDEIVEEQTVEGGVLFDCLNEKDAIDGKKVNGKIKDLKKTSPDSEEHRILCEYARLTGALKEQKRYLDIRSSVLDEDCKKKYAELTMDEIKELLVDRKWYDTIFDGIKALYTTTSHEIAGRITALAERYENTLPELESELESYEAKVKVHLERMGFVW